MVVLIVIVLIVLILVLVLIVLLIVLTATLLVLILVLVLLVLVVVATATTTLIVILDVLLGVGVVVLGFQIGRIQTQRTLEGRQRLLILFLLKKRVAEVVVGVGAVERRAGRIGRQRRKNLLRLVETLLLVERIAEVKLRLETGVTQLLRLAVTLLGTVVVQTLVGAVATTHTTALRPLLSLRIGRYEQRHGERKGQIYNSFH